MQQERSEGLREMGTPSHCSVLGPQREVSHTEEASHVPNLHQSRMSGTQPSVLGLLGSSQRLPAAPQEAPANGDMGAAPDVSDGVWLFPWPIFAFRF